MAALQISFRGLLPDERLIALCSERYRLLRMLRPAIDECQVTIELRPGRRGALVSVSASLCEANEPACEAAACHANAQVALRLVLAQLGRDAGVRGAAHELAVLHHQVATSSPPQGARTAQRKNTQDGGRHAYRHRGWGGAQRVAVPRSGSTGSP